MTAGRDRPRWPGTGGGTVACDSEPVTAVPPPIPPDVVTGKTGGAIRCQNINVAIPGHSDRVTES
jgi:hypothetical protein